MTRLLSFVSLVRTKLPFFLLIYTDKHLDLVAEYVDLSGRNLIAILGG